MVTKKLGKTEKAYLKSLGKKIRKIIIEDLGYSSLDAFSAEFHDYVARPTLYQICDGKRDMKLSTLLALSISIGINIEDLLSDL